MGVQFLRRHFARKTVASELGAERRCQMARLSEDEVKLLLTFDLEDEDEDLDEILIFDEEREDSFVLP